MQYYLINTYRIVNESQHTFYNISMERNITLDFFRLILSLLVITIHIQPLFSKDSITGWVISDGIARIAVPCFFIINGYYVATKIDNFSSVKKYLGHLLLVYIVWSLVYLYSTFQDMTALSLAKTLIIGYCHLWYLPALVLSVFLLYLIKKYTKLGVSVILIIGVILFAVGYIFEPMRTNAATFRNGLFIGFPFVAMGYYIKVKSADINFKKSVLLIIAVLSLIGIGIESYFAYKIDFQREFYILLLVCCPALFLLTLKYKVNKPAESFLGNIGNFSAVIYYAHWYVIWRLINMPEEYRIYDLPLILMILTLISIVIVYINKRVKIFF